MELNVINCNCFLKYESANSSLINYNKCLSCNKNYSRNIDKELKKPLRNTIKFFKMISINLLCR